MSQRERPIIFSPAMVRAILDGKKSQTRRVVQPQRQMVACNQWPDGSWRFADDGPEGTVKNAIDVRCPYGQPGDRLWVREAFCAGVPAHPSGIGIIPHTQIKPGMKVVYRATDDYGDDPPPWRSPIHMPRWASRLMLELTAVRVEQLQEITPEDATAEGVDALDDYFPLRGRRMTLEQHAYAALFDALNRKRGYSWEANPWVWVLTFRRVEG